MRIVMPLSIRHCNDPCTPDPPNKSNPCTYNIRHKINRNPPEQKKLRDELSQLSPEEWNKSEHLKMVIKEGMRLHPVASAGSLRKIGRDIFTPNKELIPKGSICFCPFILLFRNPDILPDPTYSIRGVGRTQLETSWMRSIPSLLESKIA